MTKTTVPGKTSPAGSAKTGSGKDPSKSKSPTAVFMTAALDMSWRLAVVVLVPIIGGFELDKSFHTVPALTILGFIVAMAGVVIVLKQMLKEVGQMPLPTADKNSNKGAKS